MKKLLITTLLLSSALSAENSIGLDINNEDVEILGSVNLNTLANYADGTTYILDASYLHTDGDNMSSVGISGQNSLQGIPGLTLAFGAKVIFASDFMAVPLMAKGIYTLPLNDNIPTTSLLSSFAYAPSVLTFRDGDSYSEFRLEADMEVISNVHLFTGYRNIDTDYEAGDQNFNDSFYGGLKLSF
ncbi:YfaZ family outer membrane protein [Sulfurovum sp.]|uniref:YfaZ family outer membrane protein n=1 Tax=Sulfurovum sp. TaxID=1969726 RepID=UPI0025D24F4C|nr:YfaZ family outer membrane protein [Sulfurovum sp.]